MRNDKLMRAIDKRCRCLYGHGRGVYLHRSAVEGRAQCECVTAASGLMPREKIINDYIKVPNASPADDAIDSHK